MNNEHHITYENTMRTLTLLSFNQFNLNISHHIINIVK